MTKRAYATEDGVALVVELITHDSWMMEILRTIKCLNLPDAWAAGGFIRNKVWDHLHDYKERTPLQDVDVVYFDKEDTSVETEQKIEKKLGQMAPDVPWSVRNQARMHIRDGDAPYTSTYDALLKWPETATAVGASLSEDGEVIALCPHGVQDLLDLEVRPTPKFLERRHRYEERIKEKGWQIIWPKLKIFRFPASNMTS